jgi:SAM-dependent methyltransferase
MSEREKGHIPRRSFAESPSQNPAEEMRRALIAKLLVRGGDPQAAHVLDIGSRQGDLLQIIQGILPDAKCLGVELNAGDVDVARRKIPGATFIAGDIMRAPAPLKNYQGWATHSACAELLAHVESPVALLRAARVYLRQDARLIVTVPGGPMSAFDQHAGHRRHFTRDSIRDVLHAGGFEVDRVYLAGFPFFNLYCVFAAALADKAADRPGRQRRKASWTAEAARAVFRGLFCFNLMHFPLGWQIVAVARKSAVAELAPYRAVREADIGAVELEPGARWGRGGSR